jgi:tetrapyrrole methylase family protein/MazG family protein
MSIDKVIDSRMDPAAAFVRLVDIMAQLRAPGGCPWDREQSAESLLPYVIEEAYEVVEAIESGDTNEIRDELGDLLLQVVFHAEIARERGAFDIADVCRAISDKLERRHPHVFGDVTARTADEVVRNWARIKAGERAARGGADGALAGVPASLPALLQAERIAEKASHVGFDWPTVAGVLVKLREEIDELERAVASADGTAAAAELGDVLFTLASVGRHLGSSAEQALRAATARFARRFAVMERQAADAERPLAECDPEELERLWRLAKATAG